jgi:tetratricopeptide (TPR) repeat protein
MGAVSLTLSQALDIALKAYSAGKLAEAEQICLRIIAADPESAAALNLLAVTYASLGRSEMALSSYDRALALRPDFIQAWNNRGAVLKQLQRFSEALECYDRALELQPDTVEVLNNRAGVLHDMRRHGEALAGYDRALALRPNYPEALNNRGIALQALGRHEDALTSYDSALALRPDFVEALYNRGIALHHLERLDEALASYDAALVLRPDYAGALVSRALALHDLKQFDRALDAYGRALVLAPDHLETLTNRGVLLHDLARYDEALASHDRAISVQPNHAAALDNRGVTLRKLGRFGEALASHDSALAARPDYAEAFVNRGVTLYDLKRFDEASGSYDRAIALRPEYADAHFLKGLSSLVTGDLARGWIEYEWRRKAAVAGITPRDFPQPLWLGDGDIAGKTILLHSEQGFGDSIQFCRYAPLVAAGGARVIVEVEAPLRELMISGLAGTAEIVAKGSPLPDFDLHCPLPSLPLAFKTGLDTIPSGVPYLRAPKQAMAHWAASLGAKHGPRIGLAWAGNAKHVRDGERSMRLRDLLPLLDIDASFVSLQKEVRAGDAETLANSGMLRFGERLCDFSDTAGLISQLDLVISVDTGVAHLAGALRKPVWILLTHAPDWRWLLDREDSPWYPSARLFRQSDAREWGSVIARVGDALVEWVAMVKAREGSARG